VIENFKLTVFRVVADSLSFRRAAEELHLTQPAITSQVKTLEDGLGMALFDCIGRDINLTRCVGESSHGGTGWCKQRKKLWS
jgi:Bacterial regulatory helix-turn-helix protein, lysR family